jgi:hypothetical protein
MPGTRPHLAHLPLTAAGAPRSPPATVLLRSVSAWIRALRQRQFQLYGHQRWPIEEDFEFGKDCFGLDQSQVRLYTAIARHTVLVMVALAICAVTAAQLRDRTDTQAPPPVRPDQPPPPEPGMIPLTVPEVKRLLAAATTTPSRPGHAEHWSGWTRRHQARSRWYHQRTRLARDQDLTLKPLVS